MIVCGITVIEMGELLWEIASNQEKTQFYYRFKAGDKTFRADLEVRRPVTTFNDTLFPQY